MAARHLPTPAAERPAPRRLALACLLGLAAVLGGAGARADSGDLARFHARLAALESGAVRQVHVLQIGDSHTAGDHFSGRLRALLQQRFGNGGRGFLAPGVPHPNYNPQQVAVTQSGPWQLLTSNKTPADAAAFGLSGIVMRAPATGGATMTIEDRSGAETAWLEVDYLARADGGSLEVAVDGEPYGRIDTREPAPALIRLEGRGRRVVLRAAGGGSVDLASLRLVANDRGLVLSSVGFIGARVDIMGRWHGETLRRQLRELHPALVIVAFGTNEGFGAAGRIEGGYARELDRRLAALRDAAPDASIVIVGPPDANRYPRYCLPAPKVVWQPVTKDNREKLKNGDKQRDNERDNGKDTGKDAESARSVPPALPAADPATAPPEPALSPPNGERRRDAAGGDKAEARDATVSTPGDARPPADAAPAPPQPAAIPGEQRPAATPEPEAKPGFKRVLVWPDPPADAQCRPLEPDERRAYDELIEGKDRRLCRWHTPAALLHVRRLQREAAARHQALFFDWFELFESECGADRWARRGLAHKDRVHFRPEGYARAADRLHAALLAGYGRAR